MDIKAYVDSNTLSQRKAHIDNTSACIPAKTIRKHKDREAGSIPLSHMTSMSKAKENLKAFLGLSGNTNRNIHTCHTCNNDSKNNTFVCSNPKHLYFGTPIENIDDQGNIGFNRKTSTCEWCGKTGQNNAMKRWHHDNCKHKGENNA